MSDTIQNQPTNTGPIINGPTVTVIPAESLAAQDRRRDRALTYVAGGGFVMTIFIFVALYLLQGHAGNVYWLAQSAMLNILVIFTGILALLVKRNLNISKAGVVVSDTDLKT